MQAELLRGCKWECCGSGLAEMPQSSACAVVRAELGTETLSRLWGVRGKSTEEGLCPVSQRHWCSPRCVQGVRRFSLVSYQVLLLFCWSSNIPSWARAPWWSSQTCPNQALSSFLSLVFCGTFAYWPNKKASSYIQILELLLDCQIPKLCLEFWSAKHLSPPLASSFGALGGCW